MKSGMHVFIDDVSKPRVSGGMCAHRGTRGLVCWISGQAAGLGGINNPNNQN